jgi:DNA-binding NtrC family response regulator
VSFAGFLATDPATRRLVEVAARAAARASSILVTGESGVGKSRLARAMHDSTRGTAAPFVVIDCAALPEGLAENELFGHEAGAYSGADSRRAGKFEAASGGTVLLDRVSDLPLDVQRKLLRVLEERAFERLGGQETVEVDVNVIATSTDDLGALVHEKRFREDLFYRLDVVHVEVPPLRERPRDVAALARHFAEREAERAGTAASLSERALRCLEARSWPGNVRELQNAVERAVALAAGGDVLEEHVAPGGDLRPRSAERAIAELSDMRLSLEQVETLYIARVIAACGGRIGRAAAVLGIHRKTLLEKRKRHGLD